MTRRMAGLVLALLVARASQAGQAPISGDGAGAGSAPSPLPFAIDGPPPPTAPDVISRDAAGGATVRAVRVTGPLRIDGRLEETVYETVPPISGFVQNEPQVGAPASEQTAVWLLFDNDNLYITFKCWESQPDRMIVNEMRRDINTVQNETVSVLLDTFYDRRNGVIFIVAPNGGRMDGQVTNERQWNSDWNPVWDLAVGRFAGGWTVEAAIPFKALRYRSGRDQVWGLNLRRWIRWKNEVSFMKPMPATRADSEILHVSAAGTLVGLEVPPGSKNLDVKPYVTSELTSDQVAVPRLSNKLDAKGGLDVKYGVTQNLTADFTYNTDFAQVEADEQQINLTRFSLFFPEKREFFLENQGTFNFGGVGTNTSGDTPILFYSRQIGLSQGRSVPIVAGGRVTGRLGRFSLGALNVQSDDQPAAGALATNFSVLRLKRDILRKSSVGAIATRRSRTQSGIGSNEVYGIDGTFAFYDNLAINSYAAVTRTNGRSGDDTSYRAQLDYTGDRFGVQAERLTVGRNFNPEVGFVRRPDMQRSAGMFRYSRRPRSKKVIRKFSWTGSAAYIENGAGRLESRDSYAQFDIELQNSDKFSAGYDDQYELLTRPFRIVPTVTIPVGAYGFRSGYAQYNFGRQRKLSGNVTVNSGSFYSGNKTTIGVSSGRLRLTPQLSFEPTVSINRVSLLEGQFTSRLAGSRIIYSVTPLMFVSALVQYNSTDSTVSTNARLRWEYRPGSELFIVYNDQRDTFGDRFANLENRAFLVKVNKLFRF